MLSDLNGKVVFVGQCHDNEEYFAIFIDFIDPETGNFLGQRTMIDESFISNFFKQNCRYEQCRISVKTWTQLNKFPSSLKVVNRPKTFARLLFVGIACPPPVCCRIVYTLL